MKSPSEKLRVFVVDDDDDTRELLCDLFGDAGCDTRGFADARSALDAARVDPPDAIVTDLTLPDLSGEELARAIRGERSLKHIRVVATTGRDVDPKDAHLFDHVLKKPFDIDDVLALVTSSGPGPRAPDGD